MKTIKGVHDIIEQGVAEFEGHGVEIKKKWANSCKPGG